MTETPAAPAPEPTWMADNGKLVQPGWQHTPIATLTVEIENLTDPAEARALAYACEQTAAYMFLSGDQSIHNPAQLWYAVGVGLTNWAQRTEDDHALLM